MLTTSNVLRSAIFRRSQRTDRLVKLVSTKLEPVQILELIVPKSAWVINDGSYSVRHNQIDRVRCSISHHDCACHLHTPLGAGANARLKKSVRITHAPVEVVWFKSGPHPRIWAGKQLNPEHPSKWNVHK